MRNHEKDIVRLVNIDSLLINCCIPAMVACHQKVAWGCFFVVGLGLCMFSSSCPLMKFPCVKNL